LAVTSAEVCFVLVTIGWSFIDGCGGAFWEELVVFLCVVYVLVRPLACLSLRGSEDIHIVAAAATSRTGLFQ
jgi:hypothetical protein